MNENTIEPGFCHCGCGRKTRVAPRTDRTKGWTKGEPLKYALGHNGTRPLAERLHADTATNPDTGCVIYRPGSVGRYGQISVDGKGGTNALAHRVAYELRHGAIPEGHHLHHVCREKRCINPSHLLPVPSTEHKTLEAEEAMIVAGVASGQLWEELRALPPADGWPAGELGALLPAEVTA